MTLCISTVLSFPPSFPHYHVDILRPGAGSPSAGAGPLLELGAGPPAACLGVSKLVRSRSQLPSVQHHCRQHPEEVHPMEEVIVTDWEAEARHCGSRLWSWRVNENLR